MNVALKSTTQRRVSYFLFGTSMVGLGIFTGSVIAAVAKDTEAADIYAKAQKENIDRNTLDRYASARDSRNILSATAIGTMLLTLGVGASAGATYWFDSSSRAPAGSGRSEARVSVAPLAGGGFVSVGLGF
jgi:hypothetical protein